MLTPLYGDDTPKKKPPAVDPNNPLAPPPTDLTQPPAPATTGTLKAPSGAFDVPGSTPNPGGTPVGAAMPDAPPAPAPLPIPAVGSAAPTSYQGTAPDPQGIAYGGATPAPTTSPLTGMTEQQKNEFWAQRFNDAGQTGVVLPAGTPSTGVGSNGVNTYNPATLTSQQNTLAAAGASDPAIQAALAQTATNQLPTPLAENDPGYQQFVKDQNVKAAQSAGGVLPSPTPGTATDLTPNTATTGTKAVLETNPSGIQSPGVGSDTGAYGGQGSIPAVGTGVGATVTPPATPATPGVSGTTTFGPDQNIINTQINPTPSGELTNLNGLVSNAANAVGNGQSRGDIAKGYLDAFDTAAQPQIRDQIRAVGQRASALGRLGMGDTAVEALNPYTDYLTQRSALEKTLASDSAAGDITDRLNNLGALSGVQNTTNSQEANARNETRGERQYQYGTSEQAFADMLQQYLASLQGEQQQFNEGSTLAGIGYGNSPSNLYFGAGQQYGQNAGLDFNALASFLAPYLQPKGG